MGLFGFGKKNNDEKFKHYTDCVFQDSLKQFELGLVIGKQWISSKWCPCNHDEINGQVRKLTDYFDVNGDQMMYPRDETEGISSKNIKGCKCMYKRLWDEVDNHLIEEQ